MKNFLAVALAGSFLLLPGCIVVHDHKPEAVSTSTTTTTRKTSVAAPSSTTVERTTVY